MHKTGQSGKQGWHWADAADIRFAKSFRRVYDRGMRRFSSFLPALLNVSSRAWPAAALAAMLVWGWKGQDLLHSIPHYGDTLEMMWALSWYGDAIRAGHSIAVYPQAFYPGGWHYAENLVMLLALLPLQWIGGPAFAYNIGVLLSFIVAFLGSYKLAREFLGRGPATIASLLISFWGFRWFHTIGHLNILIGSALLPWILWTLDRALRAPGRSRRWLVLTGVLWAASMSGSMYFAWLAGVAALAWIAGYLSTRAIRWQTAVGALAISAGVALLLSAPAIYWMWQNTSKDGVAFYTIGELNYWNASLNSLPLPSIEHPLLGSFARSAFGGQPYEQGATNLGLLASLLAIAGLCAALRLPRWRPVLFLAGAGLLLALGLTLRWNNTSLGWPPLRPINVGLWQLGHLLKPSLFPTAQPPVPFDNAVPLPGLLLVAVVPLMERARVFARYILVGAIGIFLLTGLGLTLARRAWVRIALALLLVLEILPTPLTALPFPPEPHPAFDWLKQQRLSTESDGVGGGEGIADIVAAHPYTPVLLNDGETVLATLYHGKGTAAGASSVWPAATAFLNTWLSSHEHAFWNPDTVPILRFYRIRYILLHMRGDWEQGILAEARQNKEIKPLQCFEPPEGPGPWDYPICVLEVLPPSQPSVNLVMEDGWSGREDWGVWAEGTTSRAFWVATEKTPSTLQVQVFPLCRSDQYQSVSFEINGETVATHDWNDCEPWSSALTVPASLVRLGRNDLVVRSEYAARPIELGDKQSNDTRPLSVGFTRLRVEPGIVQ
jgi:hypothetical protein